jgi:hypothetical protein
MFFHLVQILYWLALSTWFGGVLFIAVAAPIIFRTVRENDPLMPTVLSVNLEGQHATLLAGSVVANLLSMLVRIELACAAGLLVAMVGQWFTTDAHANWIPYLVRGVLLIGAAALIAYDWRVVGPRIEKFRRQYIDHADEPEVANAAREQFDRYHRESVTTLLLRAMLLTGMVLFSARIVPDITTIVFPR